MPQKSKIGNTSVIVFAQNAGGSLLQLTGVGAHFFAQVG
jgi:hypothetical protein